MINIITAPDFLCNENPNILLVNPSSDNKDKLNKWLLDIDLDLNIYVYTDESVDWLINVAASSDIIFCDIDNSGSHLRLVIGNFLSKNKTFYLTNDTSMPYNKLNPNKIDSMDIFAKKIRGIYGKE